MNIKKVQKIAAWLILGISISPLLHLPVFLLLMGFIISTALALAVFFDWRKSFPWVIYCASLILFSFYKIPSDVSDRTRLVIFISICCIGLAVMNELSFYIAAKQEGKD